MAHGQDFKKNWRWYSKLVWYLSYPLLFSPIIDAFEAYINWLNEKPEKKAKAILAKTPSTAAKYTRYVDTVTRYESNSSVTAVANSNILLTAGLQNSDNARSLLASQPICQNILGKEKVEQLIKKYNREISGSYLCEYAKSIRMEQWAHKQAEKNISAKKAERGLFFSEHRKEKEAKKTEATEKQQNREKDDFPFPE